MLRLFPALALVLSLGLAGSGTVSAAPLITVETAPGDDAAPSLTASSALMRPIRARSSSR